MLSASIQSSVSQSPAESTVITANAVGQSGNADLEQGKKIASQNSVGGGVAQGDSFSGQLNNALSENFIHGEPALTDGNEEQFIAEASNLEAKEQAQDQQGQRDQQQQPSAEEWLQAMLEQHQLQVQTRDKVDGVDNPVAIASAVMLTSVPVSNAALVNANLRGNSDAAANAIDNRLVDNSVVDKSLANNDLGNKTIAAPQATVVAAADLSSASGSGNNPIADTTFSPSVLNANSPRFPAQNDLVNAAPSAEGANNKLAANPASAINSATSFSQLASAVLGETTASEPASVTAATSLTATGAESAQRVQSQITLQAPEAKWGEQLLHALRDNVQVQIQEKIQNATIRLDPPELGSLEIFLSHESGRLTVQITASQADVARLIQATSERLRQELAGPQFTQVNVQTSAEGQTGQQQSRERQRSLGDEMILANEQEFVSNDVTPRRAGDVLVTV